MTFSNHPSTLTEKSHSEAIARLAAAHPEFAGVIRAWGEPPFWTHPPGFPGVVLAILGQQVSIESAQAAFTRLHDRLNVVTPETFLTLDDDALRSIGFSRQKTSYVRELADRILRGRLDLDALESLADDEARAALMEIKGIGVWTADTYLLFALRRADAWPSRDLALAKGIQELRGLPDMPSWEETDAIAEGWRPWRAMAARILWHYYLSVRGRTG